MHATCMAEFASVRFSHIYYEEIENGSRAFVSDENARRLGEYERYVYSVHEA
jgi:hypothetical protein